MSQYGTILGFVSTPGGEAIEGATVLIVTGPAHADIAALTDERGQFELSDLDPGYYVIRVAADGCEPVREGVRVRRGQVSRIYAFLQNNVEGEIESDGNAEAAHPMILQERCNVTSGITGTVLLIRDGRAEPIADIPITISWSSEPVADIAVITTENGEFELSNLPAGSYGIRIRNVEVAVHILSHSDRIILYVVLPQLERNAEIAEDRLTTVQTELEDSHWVLMSYEGNGVLEGTKITAEFRNGQVTGSAGCNTYDASYESTTAELQVRATGATEIFCDQPEGIMEQETAYLRLLQSSATYQISEGKLTIYDSSGNCILAYTSERSRQVRRRASSAAPRRSNKGRRD